MLILGKRELRVQYEGVKMSAPVYVEFDASLWRSSYKTCNKTRLQYEVNILIYRNTYRKFGITKLDVFSRCTCTCISSQSWYLKDNT